MNDLKKRNAYLRVLNPVTLLVIGLAISSCGGLNRSKNSAYEEDPAYTTAKMAMYQGDFATSVETLKHLVSVYPENPQYRSMLKVQQSLQIANQLKQAENLLLAQSYEQAEESFKATLLLDPKNQRASAGLLKLAQIQNHSMMLTNAQLAVDKQEIETAKNLLRAILAENAQHTAAKALFERIENQRVDKIITTPAIETAFKKPITLEFKSVSLKTLFDLIGNAANINFAYDQELRDTQKTSIFVRNTTIEEAIEIVLTTNQLGKKVLNHHTVLIYPLSRSQEYQEQYVRSFYLNSIDAKRALNLIKTVVKSKDVYIDEKLNTLVMRDTLEAIQVAEKLITSQDMLEPEVMLEVEVMEINRRSLENIGIRYPSQVSLGVQGKSTSDGVTTNTPGRLSLAELKNFNSGLGVFTINDPVLAFNLLQQDTDTNLLANPQIRVKNREKAKIHVGDKIPVLTSVANSTGFVSQTVSYIDVGIKLDVEPTILLQDQVNIKVGLEVSNIIDQVRTDSGVLAYTIGSRNANTVLQLKDGETQILAGLFRDDGQRINNKVPGLSKLPFIGRLFSDKNDDKRKNEIVLLITPRILHNIAPANAVYTLFPAGISHATNQRGGRQQEPVAPAIEAVTSPAAQTPSQTPQSAQAERAQVDANFASQLLQPGADPSANGSTNNNAPIGGAPMNSAPLQ